MDVASSQIMNSYTPKLLFPLALLIATAILYGQFLYNPIVFDDLNLFNSGHKVLENITNTANVLNLRWFPYATLAWTGKYLGMELINFRIVSLLLHASVGISLYYFLYQIYKLLLPNWHTSSNHVSRMPLQWVAFFAALIFILHPIEVYGAAYLIQRSIVMATLFSLLALNAYTSALTKSDKNHWLYLTLAFYALAVLSKEHAVTLVGIMMCLTVLLRDKLTITRKQLFIFAIGCLFISIFALIQKVNFIGKVYEFSAQETIDTAEIAHPYMISILTQSWLFFKYLALWVLPNPAWLSIDMREPFASGIFSIYIVAFLAYLSYGLIAAYLLFQRGIKGLLGFALLFPWVMFATEFSSVRIQEPFVLYRSYLWMPGIFLALPCLIYLLSFRKAFIYLLTVSLLFAVGSFNRLTTFSDPIMIWTDAEWLIRGKQHLLGADRIYYNRGKHLTDSKYYREAAEDFITAIRLKPTSSLYHFGLAGAYYGLENYSGAVEEFSLAIKYDEKNSRALYWRGVSYNKLGMLQEAQADFSISCKTGWPEGCSSIK